MLLQNLAKVFPTGLHIIAVEDGSVRDPLKVSDLSEAGLKGDIVYLGNL